MAERRHIGSKKMDKGYDMLQSLLLPDSAPVLSLNVFKQIGMRCAGKNLAVTDKRAIWANVSKEEMECCISESRSTSNAEKSA